MDVVTTFSVNQSNLFVMFTESYNLETYPDTRILTLVQAHAQSLQENVCRHATRRHLLWFAILLPSNLTSNADILQTR